MAKSSKHERGKSDVIGFGKMTAVAAGGGVAGMGSQGEGVVSKGPGVGPSTRCGARWTARRTSTSSTQSSSRAPWRVRPPPPFPLLKLGSNQCSLWLIFIFREGKKSLFLRVCSVSSFSVMSVRLCVVVFFSLMILSCPVLRWLKVLESI